MIDKSLWYIEGLKESISLHTEDKWLINYFKEHSEKIVYEACEWLVTNEDSQKFYSLCLNGDEDNKISFIIQYCCNDLEHFWVKSDYSDIKEIFKIALNRFNKLVEELE